MRVYLAQCLCPSRHAVLGNYGEFPDDAAAMDLEASLLKTINEWIAGNVINPWCAICRAKRDQWHVEVGRTRYTTIAEALPDFEAVQAANLWSQVEILKMQEKAKGN